MGNQELALESLVAATPNRSLNLTAPRAGFSVRREYGEGSMLVVKQVLGDNTKNITQTVVQNGRRRLAPNR